MGHLRPFTLLAFTDLPFTKSESLGERLGNLGPERLIYLQGLRLSESAFCLFLPNHLPDDSTGYEPKLQDFT